MLNDCKKFYFDASKTKKCVIFFQIGTDSSTDNIVVHKYFIHNYTAREYGNQLGSRHNLNVFFGPRVPWVPHFPYAQIMMVMSTLFDCFHIFILKNKHKCRIMVRMDKLYFICWNVWSKNKHIFSVLSHLLSSWFIFRKNCANIYHFTYSRICLIRHLKGIRKKWPLRRSDELCKQVKTLPQKLVYFIVLTRTRSAFICSKIQVHDVMVQYSNPLSRLLHLITF